MKKKLFITSVVISFFLKIISKGITHSPIYKSISYSEGKELMDKTNCVILDVRSKKEFIARRLSNSILIYEEDLVRQAETMLKKSDIIIVYSDSKVKSKRVCKTLVALGYNYIFDMGDINKWPYEIVSGNDFKIRKLS